MLYMRGFSYCNRVVIATNFILIMLPLDSAMRNLFKSLTRGGVFSFSSFMKFKGLKNQ